MIDQVLAFAGEHAFLSNFFEREFVGPNFNGSVDNVHYLSGEHCFQANKARSYEDFERVLGAPTPGKAKRAGRNIPLREDWDDVRIDVMRWTVDLKFADQDLARQLRGTGDALLVEGNNWNDTVWGACWTETIPISGSRCWAISGGRELWGRNELGKILMEKRDALRKA